MLKDKLHSSYNLNSRVPYYGPQTQLPLYCCWHSPPPNSPFTYTIPNSTEIIGQVLLPTSSKLETQFEGRDHRGMHI